MNTKDETKLRLIIVEPPTGKFVALYNDGSGATIYQRLENGDLIDSEGELYTDENLDSYLYWIPLPDDFKLWWEIS